MDEEEIIKRRLLIDGDGTGDERRINILLKKFFKWCNSEDSTPDGKDHLLSQIIHCEYAFVKSRLGAEMMASEFEKHSDIAKETKETLAQVQKDIEETKKEFLEAKIIRKNRLEYETLLKTIAEQPVRKETTEKLSLIKQQLHALEEKLELLEAKMDIRRKQFHVFFTSLKQLQSAVDAGDSLANETFDVMDEEYEDLSVLINTSTSPSVAHSPLQQES